MATASSAAKKRLEEQRGRLMDEIVAIRHRIEGLEIAISTLEDEEEAKKQSRSSGRQKNLKKIVLDLLEEAGTRGLNATLAVQTAERRNIEIDRNSVSSLLSRLKRDDVVDYDGHRYRLKVFSASAAGVARRRVRSEPDNARKRLDDTQQFRDINEATKAAILALNRNLKS